MTTIPSRPHGHPDRDHRHHPHEAGAGSRNALVALAVTLGFSVFEAAGALFTHSLALLGDAGHMLFDAIALAVSAGAYWVSRKPPSRRHSYGLARAEIVAALANALLMVGIVIALVVEAVRRLQAPAPVDGGVVMIVAAIGFVANLAVIYILSRGRQSLNSRAAVLHAVGDLLGSIAAIISGGVIYFSGWLPIDPILSILIAMLILYSTIVLLREALNVLMEGVPFGLELEIVGTRMAELRGVVSVHDLHVWTLSSGVLALSAHVVVRDLSEWNRLLQATRSMLLDRFGIGHVTLQPELEGAPARVPSYRSVIPIHLKD
ncbi:MAG: cation diffusion facilitator family transporter [Acidimicrobiales bacterium]